MKRSEARIILMQAIFQMEAQQDFSDVLLERFLGQQNKLDKSSREYIVTTFHTLNKNLKKIDTTIEKYSRGWSVDRMAKVDLAILRLAVAELICDLDVPQRVAINEAVEMAKKFGLADSRKFINGILGTISRAE